MSVTTTLPPAPPKKRGLGCLGCGCLVLAVLVILFFGLLIGGAYVGLNNFTSTTPVAVPTFDGGDTVYQTAQQKITDFGHDMENHQAATIELSADELNTLIARDPDLLGQNGHIFVTLTGDQARVQGSVPAEKLAVWMPKGRYCNFDLTAGVEFNSDAKSLGLILHELQIGQQTTPTDALPFMQSELDLLLNAELQKSPATHVLLQQVKSIEIKDGQLVMVTP